MADQVVFGDLEAWLCAEIRQRLQPPAGWTLLADVQEPRPWPTSPALVVLVFDDGGSRDLVTRNHNIRIRVVGPDTDPRGEQTGDTARTIDLILASCARPHGMVSAFLGSQGPVRVHNPDSDRPEFLLLAELQQAGAEPA